MQGRISSREARAEVKPRTIKASSGELEKQWKEDGQMMGVRGFRIRNSEPGSRVDAEVRAD